MSFKQFSIIVFLNILVALGTAVLVILVPDFQMPITASIYWIFASLWQSYQDHQANGQP